MINLIGGSDKKSSIPESGSESSLLVGAKRVYAEVKNPDGKRLMCPDTGTSAAWLPMARMVFLGVSFVAQKGCKLQRGDLMTSCIVLSAAWSV